MSIPTIHVYAYRHINLHGIVEPVNIRDIQGRRHEFEGGGVNALEVGGGRSIQ